MFLNNKVYLYKNNFYGVLNLKLNKLINLKIFIFS